MTPIEIRSLRRTEIGRLTRLLWRAFEPDPLFRFLFQSRWYAGRAVRLLFTAQARDALRHGTIDVVVVDHRILAAAVWLSPGNAVTPTVGRMLAGLPAYVALGLLFLDRLPDLCRMAPGAPGAPDGAGKRHWHLEYLAVDPGRQGNGLGSRLLEHGLGRADEAGLACGLDTSSERALALYRRAGFEIRNEARPFAGGPPIWSMWRPAAADGRVMDPGPPSRR
jgi:ribosomal protein S18 acetylase RimI-like enzyme